MLMPVKQFDPKHPERGWHKAEPLKPPRHWPWLQRIVDWIWQWKQKP